MQARAICALLPLGWAWEAADIGGTLMNGRVKSIAHMLQIFHEMACGLPKELHCFSADKTISSWLADYGLPDDCGINDLCAKVIAVGGQNCTSYAELGQLLGFDICCADVPIEIQPGGWNLGCEQMPPGITPRYGGSELGFAAIGMCQSVETGSDLGVDMHGDDCRIAGYHVDDVPVASSRPCDTEATCVRYEPKFHATLITGCYTPLDVSQYTGTAHHWMVATNDHLPRATPRLEPFAVSTCWDMGQSELCLPPEEQVMCFIRKLKPAHTVVVHRYCEDGVFQI